MDRLSELPDSIIIEILSSLNMKDAVKTGLLSKKFQKLSTQVYNLVFDFPPFQCDINMSLEEEETELRKSQNQKYVSFVDHSLMQRCNAPNINKFCLRSCFSDKETIEKWVSFVLTKNVKFLELSSLYNTPPDCLHKTSSKLTSLFLAEMHVDDESIKTILMNCPVLEILILRDVGQINHLNIRSPTVKLLELYDIWYDGYSIELVLEIRAPWIRELVISELFLVRVCQLVDVSSLVKATVTFTTHVVTLDKPKDNMQLQLYNYEWMQMVNQLLMSWHHVRELVIGSEIIQVLTLSKLTNKPTPIFKCKQLSLETRFWKFDVLGIACLLENSPDLETLFIKVLGDWEDSCPLYETLQSFTKSDGPKLGMPNIRNLVNLKNVRIEYWRYPCSDTGTAEDIKGQFFDFELVEFILKGAVSLDKLVLCTSNSSSCHCCKEGLLNCSPFQYVTYLSSKLLTTILIGNEAPEWGELRKSKNKIEFRFSNYTSLFPKDRA